MMVLKVKNAYGVAANAFHNCYLMGESIARKCCECFKEVLSNWNKLTNDYLCNMTKHDAKRIVELHLGNHGVTGLLCSLDSMHVDFCCFCCQLRQQQLLLLFSG